MKDDDRLEQLGKVGSSMARSRKRSRWQEKKLKVHLETSSVVSCTTTLAHSGTRCVQIVARDAQSGTGATSGQARMKNEPKIWTWLN